MRSVELGSAADRTGVAGPWAHPDAQWTPWPDHQAAAYLAAFRRLRPRRESDRSLRVAFLGQRSYFGPAALPDHLPGLTATFVDHVPGVDPRPAVARMRRWEPDVVIVFRPEVHGDVLAAAPRTVRVGLFTEPLLIAGWEGNRDLQRRSSEFTSLDPDACDVYVGFTPMFHDAWAAVVPVWRHLPLPVHDAAFCPLPDLPVPEAYGGIFVGRVTDRRNQFLLPVKHRYDWNVVDHGLRDLSGASVGVNLHNEDYPNAENRVPLHLARGHLVLTEPLAGYPELQDGIHLMTFADPAGLLELVSQLERAPAAFAGIARRGRLAAESYRASTVWPDLLTDLALAGA